MKMKRYILRMLPLFLLLTAILGGCSAPDGKGSVEWNEEWTAVGDVLAVEPIEGFAVSENKDVLGASGLYYVTWTRGEGESIENADGEDAVLYDAQIWLLISRSGDEDRAKAQIEDWQLREEENYRCGDSASVVCAGKTYRILPLLESGEDNPYTRGAAAFGTYGDTAVCAELLFREEGDEEPSALLEKFLSGLHYAGEEE